MRAFIRKMINAAKMGCNTGQRHRRKRCNCNDLVNCKRCRARRYDQVRARRKAGMNPRPLPYVSLFVPPSCECGECKKCLHREYMRSWRQRQ